VVVGGQIQQIIFVQRMEPLQALSGFYLPEFEQWTVLGVAVVKGAGLRERQKIGSQFISSRMSS
jgi:hypothetical protein